MDSLGVFLFSSVGAAYSALNSIFKLASSELIEFSPLGQQAQIIVRCSESSFAELSTLLKDSEPIKSKKIEDVEQKVLDTYFSLAADKIENSILVVESSFLGHLFQVANNAICAGIGLIDLKLPKAPGAHGHLILSSSSSEILSHFLLSLANEELRSHLVADIHPEFRYFFNFTPTV